MIVVGTTFDVDDLVQNRTVAMKAAREGHLACLQYAVTAGADIHAKDKEGKTVAMIAAEFGHRHCLEFAVAVGADTRMESEDASDMVSVTRFVDNASGSHCRGLSIQK